MNTKKILIPYTSKSLLKSWMKHKYGFKKLLINRKLLEKLYFGYNLFSIGTAKL